MFAWYAWGAGGVAAAAGPVPVDSPLVYRPDRRRELWRFLTYSVVHAGWLHLVFNLLVQLAVSILNICIYNTLLIDFGHGGQFSLRLNILVCAFSILFGLKVRWNNNSTLTVRDQTTPLLALRSTRV